MKNKDEALRLAFEAMKIKQEVTMWENDGDRAKFNKAIVACEAALLSRSDGEAKDEPVVGTKTWFEDGKVVTQNLYYSDVYTTPPQQEAKDEPVAWDGYNLDDMCEAFNRVIEEHFHRKHPFHDPVNNDAMIALRTLRGFIPYMKRHTTPPQRKPLTDEDIERLWPMRPTDDVINFARAIEAAHGIKGEA